MLSHHLRPDPDVIRRASGLVIIDVPYGYRDVKAKGPQARSADGRFARKHSPDRRGRLGRASEFSESTALHQSEGTIPWNTTQ